MVAELVFFVCRVRLWFGLVYKKEQQRERVPSCVSHNNYFCKRYALCLLYRSIQNHCTSWFSYISLSVQCSVHNQHTEFQLSRVTIFRYIQFKNYLASPDFSPYLNVFEWYTLKNYELNSIRITNWLCRIQYKLTYVYDFFTRWLWWLKLHWNTREKFFGSPLLYTSHRVRWMLNIFLTMNRFVLWNLAHGPITVHKWIWNIWIR